MLVIADHFGNDGVVLEKFMRLPCIFSSDEVDLLQDLNRAMGDICEVANWGGNDVKSAGHCVYCALEGMKTKATRYRLISA